MKIQINIRKSYLIIIFAVVLVGFAISYGGTQPSVMGHTLGELEGLDQQIRNVALAYSPNFFTLANLQNALPGSNLIESRRYDVGSQQAIFTPSAPFFISNLAQYADIYTGGNDRAGYQGYKGCLRAITEYCQNQGYLTASVLHPTCGAAFSNDAACPNVPGCTITFYCLKAR